VGKLSELQGAFCFLFEFEAFPPAMREIGQRQLAGWRDAYIEATLSHVKRIQNILYRLIRGHLGRIDHKNFLVPRFILATNNLFPGW
jgi:hypothetical protein